MKKEHDIIPMVLEAKTSADAADRLIEQYLPFIKAETAKYIKAIPVEGQCDELSVAMFAFYNAALSYEKHRGAFLPYAAKCMRNRLIDYSRKERRHADTVSLQATEDDNEERSLMDRLDSGEDVIERRVETTAAGEEIAHFTAELAGFGLSLTDIAENCPKQERTLAACQQALAYAKTDPMVFEILLRTKKLPLKQLAAESGTDRKTLERHRKYLVAILLAYTNGFEIIRGHLKQIAPGKGGRDR